MSKTRKQILQELLDLEESKVEDVEKIGQDVQIYAVNEEREPDNSDSILRPKKQRTQKQIEAFERAKAIRDANALKRKEESRLRDEAEKKLIEEKLVKKAIALKKKQIKKQAVLDEVSDDDTPIEKIKAIAEATAKVQTKPEVKVPKFTFF